MLLLKMVSTMDKLIGDFGKGLHFMHLNIRSILAKGKFDMLKAQITNSNLHVVTISESWLNSKFPNTMLEIPGYYIAARKDRMNTAKTRGGGLLTYVADHLAFDDLDPSSANLMTKDIELQCFNLKVAMVRQIVIINLYRPPQGSIPVFLDKLSESITKLNLSPNSELYVLGDFNIDMLDKTSQNSKDLLLSMKLFGLLPLIDKFTRKSGNSTGIDQIFTNSNLISGSGILDLNMSDHLAIFCTRKKANEKSYKKVFTGRSYRGYVKEDFQRNLIDLDWTPFLECTDPNECWDIMENNIRSEIDKMCPVKTFKVAANKDPWITNEILEEIRDKDLALKKARRTGKHHDWAFARNERNRVGRLIEVARKDFFEEEQKNSKGDPKKFWRNIVSVIPGKKGEQANISLIDTSTNLQVQAEDTPSYINGFFTSIGTNLAKDFKSAWVPNSPPFQESNLSEIATDFEEIHTLCKEINVGKSSAIDLLATKILKDAFLVLVLQLVYLFNISLGNGIFPSKWKSATVIPLFKGGSRSDVGNYRPISLLPLPGKLLEKVVHNRISAFFETNDLLCDEQCGFRKDRSTTLSIVNLTNSLLTAINNHETCFAVFIDLKKAFDTVNHEILLQKLGHMGIKGQLLLWISNYLHDRSQKTLVNGNLSCVMPVDCGVPQGSILGPLFFISYINDVKNAIDDVEMGLYADDTVIFTHNADPLVALTDLQCNLDGFANWSNTNALSINVKKTKFMVFGSRSRVKKAKNISLSINNMQIQRVPNYKYLGFMMDPVLSFSNHISTLLCTIAHKAYILSRIRRFITEYSALRIYKAMLLPYFDYADIVYDKARQSDLDKLQRAQNKCLKICMLTNTKTDTDFVHAHTKMPKLCARRKVHLRNFMFTQKKLPHLLDSAEVFTRARDAPLFKVSTPSCEAYKRSVIYNGATEWNNLSVEMRNVDLLLPFKFHQKRWLVNTIQ